MIRIPIRKTVYFVVHQTDGQLMGGHYVLQEHAVRECADYNLRTPNIMGPGKKLVPAYRVEAFRWVPPKTRRKKA